jgi:hypothetical protein
LQLWKATVTIPAAATGITVTSPHGLSGTVVSAWIDPVALTENATVKVYDAVDAMTTPTYAVNYTQPAANAESKAALYARCRVMGTLTCVVASATAADSFVLYVYVDPNAETSLPVTGTGTFAVQAATTPTTSVSAAVTEASASVAASESTVPDAKATGGKRYDRVTVLCDNAHTVKFYGGAADFSAITNGYLIGDYTRSGVAAVSGYAGNAYLVDVSGFAFVSCVVTNDGADASTILVTHVMLD